MCVANRFKRHIQTCTLRKYVAHKHTPTRKIRPCVLKRHTPLFPAPTIFVSASTDRLTGGGGGCNDNMLFYPCAQGAHCGHSSKTESVLHYSC